MALVVYGDRIIQGYITRDGGVVVDIVSDWRTSCPYDDGIGKRVSRSDAVGEVQGSRRVGRRRVVSLVDLFAPFVVGKSVQVLLNPSVHPFIW